MFEREGVDRSVVTLCLAGDVMTGRGIDQILGTPSEPLLFEQWMRDARDYVTLAEASSGPIPRGVEPAYIWGEALGELARVSPAARIVNLETSVTRSDRYWPDKGINYRMHPANVPCLEAAALDVCVLSNNHVLDYGYDGLVETLETLHGAGIQTAGAGRDLLEAQGPAVLQVGHGRRILLFAVGCVDSGVFPSWAATETRPGVGFVDELSSISADALLARIQAARRPGDLVIVSVHWGGNWGYAVPPSHVRFAHRLIDGGVHLVHGHSSHHPRPIEVYRNQLILYGCGDLLNDYEGIVGHEDFRPDVTLMYLPTLDTTTGALRRLEMIPMQIHRFALRRASGRDGRWLAGVLSVASSRLGCGVVVREHGILELGPPAPVPR